MELTPFNYHGPLTPEQVHGRDDLLAELTERVTARRVTALLGPRRYGKTSVLGRLANDLTEIATVTIDLFGVASYTDLVGRFADALEVAAPEVREPARDLAVSVGVDIGAARAQLRLSPKRRPDPRVLYAELVSTLVKVGQRTPLLVILDEFQAIADVEGADAVLRTELQHHYQRIGLIFAGSAPTAMRAIFSRPDKPFFNQADLLDIPPLSLAAVHEIVKRGFTDTGRDPGTVPSLVHQLTRGHPQRTMRAADAAWRRSSPGVPADEVWADALGDLRTAEAPILAATYDDLQKNEQKVLRLVANEASLFGLEAASLEISSGGATHARQALVDDGKLLEQPETGLVVTDPLLTDWLRNRLPL
jgi:uncharacterized protein